MRALHLLAMLGAVLLLPACAHAQGAALLQKPITAGNCGTLAAPNLVADSGVGCSGHQVTVTDGVHGSMLLAPSTLVFPNSPAILNSTPGQPLYFLKGVATTGADGGDFQCRRTANYTGGTFGFVNPCLSVYSVVSAGTTAFEWPLLARLDNNGTAADASQNVAAYLQARKLGTGATWAVVPELLDYNADPTAPSVADEHDMSATGTDVHGMRVLFDGWLRNITGTSPVAATYGIRLNTGAGGTWGHGLYLNGSYGDGFNSTGGTFSVAPIVMATGQKICLDGAACGSAVSQSGGAISLTAPGGVLTGNLLASQVAVTGSVDILASQKLCLDGTTCANYLSQSGGTITIGATGGAPGSSTITGNTASFGALNALSVNSGGNVQVATGSKLCLDGTSCNSYLQLSGSVINFVIGGSIVMAIDSTGNVGATSKFSVSTVPGVGCSGSPSGSFGALGGIVVHC